MISDEIFRKTEGLLYRYYGKLKERDKLSYRSEVLEAKIMKIESDMKSLNFSLDDGMKAIDYSKDKISCSSVGSQMENEMIREFEKLERELEYTKKRLLKTKFRIRKIEEEAADIEFSITQLSEEAKNIVELKYSTWPKLSNIDIGLRLSMAEATVRRKRKEIVEAIAKWLNIS